METAHEEIFEWLINKWLINKYADEKTGEREEIAVPHTYIEIKEFIQEG